LIFIAIISSKTKKYPYNALTKLEQEGYIEKIEEIEEIRKYNCK